MASTHFDLEDLLARVPQSDPPSVAQQALVRLLMEIDSLPTAAEKIAQLDERIEALQALEGQVRARIIHHPDLKGQPPSPAPPASVAREFMLLMAVQTAIEKLNQTRAALARRSAPR